MKYGKENVRIILKNMILHKILRASDFEKPCFYYRLTGAALEGFLQSLWPVP